MGRTVHRAQRLIQRGPALSGSWIVKVIPLQGDRPEQGLDLFGASGVAFFPGPRLCAGHDQIRLAIQTLQRPASVFGDGLAQPQFDRLQVAHALPGEILPHQLQERLGFPEALGGNFRRLEFFLLSGVTAAIRVICSVSSTKRFASSWKR